MELHVTVPENRNLKKLFIFNKLTFKLFFIENVAEELTVTLPIPLFVTETNNLLVSIF